MNTDLNFQLAEGIQKYIILNIDDINFTDKNVYSAFAYSPRHLNRVYKQFTGKTICEYIKVLHLSQSTCDIEKGKCVLDSAIDAGYETNEGFTKAFSKMFGKTPSEYKKNGGMISRFVPYPIRHHYEYYNKGEIKMSENIVCTAYIVERPKRKMIILPSKSATDYWTFCQENGCEWDGYLNSNPLKFDTAAIVKLPDKFSKDGRSNIAAGIEVPFDYEDNSLKKGYEIIELDPCKMLFFKSQPFENIDDFCSYIDAVNEAYNSFDFKSMGVETDMSAGPYMNFGAETEKGAKIAYPVKSI